MNVVVGEVVATYNPNKDIITFYSQLRNGFSHFEQLSKLGRLAEFAREYDWIIAPLPAQLPLPSRASDLVSKWRGGVECQLT